MAEKKLPACIDPKYLSYFVLVQFMVNLFINVDNGILPAGSLVIKKDFDNMGNEKYGTLGSFVYLG